MFAVHKRLTIEEFKKKHEKVPPLTPEHLHCNSQRSRVSISTHPPQEFDLIFGGGDEKEMM
jgi:hypothetical protein